MDRAVQAGLARSDDETWRLIEGCLTPGPSPLEQMLERARDLRRRPGGEAAVNPAAVVSLWPVDDASTAVLMAKFYEHVGNGLTPASALARAKQDLRAARAHAHPFYWAPFVSFGAD
jgi:hypothetical protein